MNSLERRLFVLEECGGSQADRLADAVVLRLLERGDEADPIMAAEAKRLLASPSWSADRSFGLSFDAFSDALSRFLTPEEERELADLLAEDAKALPESRA